MTWKRQVAKFNRRVANRFVGPVLIRMPGFGEVHHRGRKSGRLYRTPVKVFRRGTGYLITLPYGPGSDWVQNVLAADGCELVVRGRHIELTQPTLIEDDGDVRIPGFARWMLSRIGSTMCLTLSRAEPGEEG